MFVIRILFLDERELEIFYFFHSFVIYLNNFKKLYILSFFFYFYYRYRHVYLFMTNLFSEVFDELSISIINAFWPEPIITIIYPDFCTLTGIVHYL